MTWLPIDTWIVVVGALCAIACALPGCFLVLRQMSMMGDAISHAVLPGLAIAFLVTGTRTSFTMFVGAAIVGVLTAVFTQWISQFGKVDRGASMGIVFTTLFALGLLLIVQAADRVDLDPGCVLYGAIEYTPLDIVATPTFGPWSVGPWQIQVPGKSFDVPRAAAMLGTVLLFNLGLISLFFKELRISAFDPELATTVGINATVMHYLLMTMVAITTVASFEAVGSIIVIAMLIVPAAAAYLLTDRLGVMLVVASIIAALSAGLGHLGAITLPKLIRYPVDGQGGETLWRSFEDTSTSGMMATAAGLLFVMAWIGGPKHGLLARRVRRKPPEPTKPSTSTQDQDVAVIR